MDYEAVIESMTNVEKILEAGQAATNPLMLIVSKKTLIHFKNKFHGLKESIRTFTKQHQEEL